MDVRRLFHLELGRTSLAMVAAAALAAGGALATMAAAHAQTGPPSPTATGVPTITVARFFGAVSSLSGAGNTLNGMVVTASINGVACGVGTVNGNKYAVDVQEVAGCITPGAKVNFLIGGRDASPGGAVPSLQGAAVQVDLTVNQATPSPTPSPSPRPSPVATVAATAPVRTATSSAPPPPPPPVLPTRAATASAATRVPTAAPPRATSTPRSTATARSVATATAKAAPAAAQKPLASAPAPRVNLPKTGTGGVASAHGGQARTALLFAALLGAVGLLAAGTLALRRKR